jgi:SAM-dependent methyltransferase
MSTMTEQFDVIALWHCLEHLQEPWRVVQEAARRLAPGGIVIVAIPNIESHEFSVLKERWRHLDTPRHLYFYPINSLAALARENGLKMLEVETNDELSKALAGDTWGNWAQRKFNQGVFQTFMARLSLRLSQYNAKRKSAGAGITAVFGLSS